MHLKNAERQHLFAGEALTVGIAYSTDAALKDVGFRVEIYNEDDILLFATDTRDIGTKLPTCTPGKHDIHLHLDCVNLLAGTYRMSLALSSDNGKITHDVHEKRYAFEMHNRNATSGIVHIPFHVTAEHNTFVLGAAF